MKTLKNQNSLLRLLTIVVILLSLFDAYTTFMGSLELFNQNKIPAFVITTVVHISLLMALLFFRIKDLKVGCLLIVLYIVATIYDLATSFYGNITLWSGNDFMASYGTLSTAEFLAYLVLAFVTTATAYLSSWLVFDKDTFGIYEGD